MHTDEYNNYILPVSNNSIIYCYSKNGQDIKQQKMFLRLVCTGSKINISKVYADSCVSNLVKNKPNLRKLLAENSDIDVIMLNDTRITRDLSELLEVQEICKKKNIRFYSNREHSFFINDKMYDAIRDFLKKLRNGDEMGYRSDVRIMTTKKGYNELKKYNDNLLKDKNTYNLLDNPDILEMGKNSCYMGWNWVKWYEEEIPINSIINGLNYLREKDISYRFARCGESYDDYEEEIFDSEKEKQESYLDYPSLVREFDDSYIIDNLKQEKEKEINL